MNLEKTINKYVTDIRNIIEKKLKEELTKLGISEDNKSIIKKYCRRMILPSKYNASCILEKYYFDNILILVFERDVNMNYSIVTPLEYSISDKEKIKKLLST